MSRSNVVQSEWRQLRDSELYQATDKLVQDSIGIAEQLRHDCDPEEDWRVRSSDALIHKLIEVAKMLREVDLRRQEERRTFEQWFAGK